MKPFALVIVFLSYLTVPFCFAQSEAAPTGDELKKKMEIFKPWVGLWKGDGVIQRGPGNTAQSNVVETIEMRLDGTVVVVEGIGKKMDPQTNAEKTVHHAFGILSYDLQSNQYKFKTYLVDGKSADAWFNVVGENKYQWGFDTPQGKVRYTIVIDPVANTWNETGEFSRDEKTWYKNFEMNLKKS